MFEELLFWSEIANLCAKVLKIKIQTFVQKFLTVNLMDLHFMITSEGAKPPSKSSSHVDPLDEELLHKSLDLYFKNFCTKVLNL